MKTKPLYYILLLIAFSLTGHGIRGQSIVEAEYFVDSDPGIGNALPLTIPTADTIDISAEIPVTSLENGHHILYTRVKNSNQEWSICNIQNFYVYTALTSDERKIAYAEYFFDSDPGANLGQAISISASDTIDKNIEIPLNSLTDGHHTLFTRVRNANNDWSTTHIQNIYVYTNEPAVNKNIESTEYYFDTDPGVDSANILNFTASAATVDELFNINSNTLSTGFHTMGIRIKDIAGRYSMTNVNSLFVFNPDTASPIVSAEYFIDTVTGIGKGTPLASFTKTDTLIKEIDLSLTSISPGDHNLYIIVTDERGRSSFNKKASFTICDVLPKANFDADFSAFDSTVYFTNTTAGYDGETQYFWDIDGNGTNEYTEPEIIHKYNVLNTYNVRLIAANSAVCRDTITKIVFADPDTCKIVAQFTASVKLSNNEALFSNTSTGSIAKYYWDFGDGTTSTSKNPIHIYNKPGFYLVTMSIKKLNSHCADSYSEVIKVGSSACRSNFSYTKSGEKEVAFNNSSLGTSLRYFWYFGDGSFSTEEEPNHTFDKGGIYKVTLTVSNPTEDCTNEFSDLIQIGIIHCNSQFSYFVDSASLTANFNSLPQAKTTKLMWSFGDGAQSIASNPQHKYKRAGIYKVGLNTYNGIDNCMDYQEQNIMIGGDNDYCDADFIYQSATDNLEVSFFDQSKGEIIGYLWNFGDDEIVGGSGNSFANPKHTYSTNDYYNVCHIVISAKARIDMICKPVIAKVGDSTKCRADFILNVDSASKTVYLTDKSEGSPTQWEWDFGNGTTSTLQNPNVKYTQSNFYLIGLSIANNASGCKSSTYKMANVAQPYKMKAGFGYEQDFSAKKAGGYPIDMIGAGLGDQSRLKWDFGDGITDTTTTTPTHEYQTGDTTYNVCYEIFDPVNDQTDKVCDDVFVQGATSIRHGKANQFTLFPNPAKDYVYIKFNILTSAYTNIRIFDMDGRLVETLMHNYKASGDYKISWNASGLKKGIYLIEFKHANNETLRRFLIKQ